jgi:putative endonuclease
MSEVRQGMISRRALISITRDRKGYTFSRRPVVLVWSEHFERITDGIAVERQLKGWSRAKKEALLRSDWAKVSELSRRRGGSAKQT